MDQADTQQGDDDQDSDEDVLDKGNFAELQDIPWTGLARTFALSPAMDLLAYVDTRTRLHVVVCYAAKKREKKLTCNVLY